MAVFRSFCRMTKTALFALGVVFVSINAYAYSCVSGLDAGDFCSNTIAYSCKAGCYCPGGSGNHNSAITTGVVASRCSDTTGDYSPENMGGENIGSYAFRCPSGFPNTADGVSKITQCYGTIPSGKYRYSYSQKFYEDFTCPKGYYCPGGTFYYEGASVGYYNRYVCAAGKYNSSTGRSGSCTAEVSAGYYSTGGGTSATPTSAGNGCLSGYSCGPCAANATSSAGASYCTCKTGYYGGSTSYPSGSNCRPASYNITYDLDGGTWPSGEEHPSSVNYDATLHVGRPQRDGWNFSAWKISNMKDGITHYRSSNGSTFSSMGTSASNSSSYSYFKNLHSDNGQTVNFTARWSKTCSAGTYYNATTQNCTTCPSGSYCGGTTGYSDDTTTKGKYDCPTGYTSNTTAKSQNDCYLSGSYTTTCAAVYAGTKYASGYTYASGTSSVSCKKYYGYTDKCIPSVSDACKITGITCDTGYSATTNTSSLLDFGKVSAGTDYISNDPIGDIECDHGDCGDYPVEPDEGEFYVWFTYGRVHGNSACVNIGGNRLDISDTISGTSGKYCWCNIDSFVPTSGTAQSHPSSWLYVYESEDENECKSDCSYGCAWRVREAYKYNYFVRSQLYNTTNTYSCLPNTYTITLDKNANDATAGTATIYEKYNTGFYSNSDATNQITSVVTPTRNGYDFIGYYTETTGGERIINENGTISVNNTKFVQNIVLYAQWGEISESEDPDPNQPSNDWCPRYEDTPDYQNVQYEKIGSVGGFPANSYYYYYYSPAGRNNKLAGCQLFYAVPNSMIPNVNTTISGYNYTMFRSLYNPETGNYEAGTQIQFSGVPNTVALHCAPGYSNKSADKGMIYYSTLYGENGAIENACTANDPGGFVEPDSPIQQTCPEDFPEYPANISAMSQCYKTCPATISNCPLYSTCSYKTADSNNRDYYAEGKIPCAIQSVPDIFTITLNDNGGSGGSGEIYEEYDEDFYSDSGLTTSITQVSVPTRSGYDFLGYYNQSETTRYINADGNISAPPSAFKQDTELYAKWIQVNINLEYTYNDENNTVNRGMCTYNSSFTVPSIDGDAKPGYTFMGWIYRKQ